MKRKKTSSQFTLKRPFWQRVFLHSMSDTLLAILLGFFMGALALSVAGYSPLAAYGKLFSVIFGSSRNMSYSFIEFATPYILTGLSVAFSFKTGIFNIGAEGQYVVGSVAALLVGYFVHAPALLHIPLSILAAILAGVLWGALVGLLKLRFGTNEILCMIMFNWIAYYLSNYIVNLRPVLAAPGKTWSHNIQDTAKITISSWSGLLSNKAHAGIFLALAAAVIVYYILDKTTLGFRLKAVGHNINAAKFAGIPTEKATMITLMISGGLASLAGGLQVMGVTYKISQFAGQEGYGFQGITVALIASSHPLGVVLSGLFYGAMKFGGTRFDAPSEIVDIIMGCIVFFIAISGLIRANIQRLTERRSEHAANDS